MFKVDKSIFLTAALLIILTMQGCALHRGNSPQHEQESVIYLPQSAESDEVLLMRYAPHFEVLDSNHNHNCIGAAAARVSADGYEAFIDTERPAIYCLVQKFSTAKDNYTNLIYRVHFPEVPWPYLTMGKNVGLLIYVTLNSQDEPVLISSVHTCGCYLAMIPTSRLPRDRWPAGWLQDDQNIYGEMIPGYLQLPGNEPPGQLTVTIRPDTHRIMNLEFRRHIRHSNSKMSPIKLQPMAALESLSLGDRVVSFFEREGRRRGYVKGSEKPLELMLMSWWAFDRQIGEDKVLGPPEETGVVFYTSLKFWAREESNIWFFPEFLDYWGWDL